MTKTIFSQLQLFQHLQHKRQFAIAVFAAFAEFLAFHRRYFSIAGGEKTLVILSNSHIGRSPNLD